ncbi:MAG: hypothetical protein HUJ25_13110 [Crocinitomicaceae bacterium]|nr:hypothetical protein [Crocinitomicaceae bacterium]
MENWCPEITSLLDKADLPYTFTKNNTLIISNRVTLHHDLYCQSPSKVLSRIQSICGLNKQRIFARKTLVKMVKRAEAISFLNQHHLMGYGGGKTYLGLYYRDKLVALAVFSKVLYMKYEDPPYHSVELERYCSISGITVVGGLDKLIKAYLKNTTVDDIVTYVDKEWSNGSSYLQLGFEVTAETEPLCFLVNSNSWTRTPVNKDFSSKELSDNEYLVSNKGNLKLRFTIPKPV